MAQHADDQHRDLHCARVASAAAALARRTGSIPVVGAGSACVGCGAATGATAADGDHAQFRAAGAAVLHCSSCREYAGGRCHGNCKRTCFVRSDRVAGARLADRHAGDVALSGAAATALSEKSWSTVQGRSRNLARTERGHQPRLGRCAVAARRTARRFRIELHATRARAGACARTHASRASRCADQCVGCRPALPAMVQSTFPTRRIAPAFRSGTGLRRRGDQPFSASAPVVCRRDVEGAIGRRSAAGAAFAGRLPLAVRSSLEGENSHVEATCTCTRAPRARCRNRADAERGRQLSGLGGAAGRGSRQCCGPTHRSVQCETYRRWGERARRRFQWHDLPRWRSSSNPGRWSRNRSSHFGGICRQTIGRRPHRSIRADRARQQSSGATRIARYAAGCDCDVGTVDACRIKQGVVWPRYSTRCTGQCACGGFPLRRVNRRDAGSRIICDHLQRTSANGLERGRRAREHGGGFPFPRQPRRVFPRLRACTRRNQG